jgi:hypothetical protein
VPKLLRSGTRSFVARPPFRELLAPLATAFEHLDRWRHFPNYQLERRADVFFSVYLKRVVEEFVGVPVEDEIVPELPLKRDLIWPEQPSNQSVKVDYVLFAKDRSRAFFVELKTDAGSRRESQDTYLEVAGRIGFRRILEGFIAILLSTTAHRKYHHLTAALARLGYLELPAGLARCLYPKQRPERASFLREIRVAHDPAIEVIYVQPVATRGDRCIDFVRFAEVVRTYSDPFSQAFATHLLAWTDIAGAREP